MPFAASDPDALFSSPRFEMVTSLSGDLDLVGIGGSPCRAIRILGDGDLVVVPAAAAKNQSGGDAVTISPLVAGDHMPLQVTTIKATGTTALPLLVMW